MSQEAIQKANIAKQHIYPEGFGEIVFYLRNNNPDKAIALLKNIKKSNKNLFFEIIHHQNSKTVLLHEAARGGYLDIVNFLLNHGADNVSRNLSGITAIEVAAYFGHKNVVLALVEDETHLLENPEVIIKAKSIALKGGHHKVVDYLQIIMNEALLHAAKKGLQKTAEFLISAGASIESKSSEGYTPLLWAVEYGHKNMIEFLIKKGADLKAKTIYDFTALHIAAKNGDKNLVEFFINNKVDVVLETTGKFTAEKMALLYGHTDIAESLKEKREQQEKQEKEARGTKRKADALANLQTEPPLKKQYGEKPTLMDLANLVDQMPYQYSNSQSLSALFFQQKQENAEAPKANQEELANPSFR